MFVNLTNKLYLPDYACQYSHHREALAIAQAVISINNYKLLNSYRDKLISQTVNNNPYYMPVGAGVVSGGHNRDVFCIDMYH